MMRRLRPQEIWRIGVYPLYALHVWEALKLLTKNLCLNIELAKLITASIESLYSEAGQNRSIFNYDIPNYLDNNTWILAIWRVVRTMNIKIHIPESLAMNPQRVRDINIMEIIDVRFRPYETKAFNECRLYLKAMVLRDIVSRDGTNIK